MSLCVESGELLALDPWAPSCLLCTAFYVKASLFLLVLGIEPRAVHVVAKCSFMELLTLAPFRFSL